MEKAERTSSRSLNMKVEHLFTEEVRCLTAARAGQVGWLPLRPSSAS
jgi:hypothetical protein